MYLPRLFAVVTLTPLCWGQDSSSAKSVSSDEAERLVRIAVDTSKGMSKPTRLPGFSMVAYNDPDLPSFIFFEATWHNPRPGSAIAGHFAVSSRTGDVWNVMGCEQLVSQRLRSEQEKVRKRLRIGAPLLKRFAKDVPCTL